MTVLTIYSTVIVTNSSAPIVTLTAGQSIHVAATGQLLYQSTGFLVPRAGIAGSPDSFRSISVAGEVFGGSSGIDVLGPNPSGFRTDISVLDTGYVSGDTGIQAPPASAIRNAGEIVGLAYEGIYADANIFISNSGLISGSSDGIGAVGTSGFLTLQNTGTITGIRGYGVYMTVAPINLTNSGQIGGLVGVGATGGGTLVNSGTISGSNGSGITGAQMSVSNTGTIHGILNGLELGQSIVVNDGFIMGGVNGIAVTGSIRLTNTGTISGVNTALSLASFNDTVVNRGVLDGRVNLGDADDVYDGRGGSVTGAIDLGLGNDTATGGDGAETFVNGTITVSDGDDGIDGGAGFDTLDYSTTGAGFRADLGRGTVRGATVGLDTVEGIEAVTGSAFADRMVAGSAAVRFLGADGADVVTGGGKGDLLSGGQQNDSLSGGGGDDRLTGGGGADTVSGGAGDDLLIGGDDADVLTGGSGADTFLFRSVAEFRAGGTGPALDRIADFVGGTDLIDLGRVDANAVTAGDQDFTFVAGAFTASGQVRAVTSGTTTTVWLCDSFAAQPAGIAVLTLTGVTAVAAGDFVL